MTRRSGWMTLLLAVALVARVEAQGMTTVFLMPFDVSQGAMTNTPGVTPYTAALKLQGALGLWRGAPLRLGPVVAVRYANPDWTAAVGGRVQWLPVRFGLGGRRWGFGVAAEQLWDTGGYLPGSLSVVADLELVRLGAGLVYEWDGERTGFELGVGTDLVSLAAVLFPREDPDPFPGIP